MMMQNNHTAFPGELELAVIWPGHGGRDPAGLAVVILGGLATSTALNMLVLPALYRRFGAAMLDLQRDRRAAEVAAEVAA